jgi:hypothetical protein
LFSGVGFAFSFVEPADGLVGEVVSDLLSGVSFADGFSFGKSFGLAFGNSWPGGTVDRFVEAGPPVAPF